MSKRTGLAIPSAKNDDQPATRKMLRLVREELKSETIESFSKVFRLFGSARTGSKSSKNVFVNSIGEAF